MKKKNFKNTEQKLVLAHRIVIAGRENFDVHLNFSFSNYDRYKYYFMV